MDMKKIVLLNLPYKDKKLQRDLSCAHTSKADYYWPSLDLLVYSAILSDQELEFIDGVMEHLDEKKLIDRIKDIGPEYIFTMISAISLKEDLAIFKKIKQLDSNIKICTSGDLASFEPKSLLKIKEIDFIISDFSERDKIRQIIANKQKERIISSSEKKEFSIGVPRHELIKKYPYNMPYSFYQPVTGLITNFGCPFKCKFCNSNNQKFKSREINEIIEEMKSIEKKGIKEFYVRDFTFGIPKIEKLLERMISENLNLKWSCEFRVDLANKKILEMMKKAGCFLIFYGGESGNQKTLDLMNKGFTIEQLENEIKMTREVGIETLVSFIVGFENESEEDILNTKRFIMRANPDYISVNVLIPRIGSKFREETNSLEDEKLDNSSEKGRIYANGKSAMDYKKEIERAFFFKPSKLARYFFLSIKTPHRFKNFLKSGTSIFKRIN